MKVDFFSHIVTQIQILHTSINITSGTEGLDTKKVDKNYFNVNIILKYQNIILFLLHFVL